MTRFIAIIAVFLAVAPPLAAAQTLVEVAKAEEARRKTVKKPSKTYGNSDLRPDTGQTPGTTPADPAQPKPGAAEVNIPLSPDPGAEAGATDGPKDEKYWTGRMADARSTLERSRMFADALQSRINALSTDVVNRDDPAQRAALETDRKKALAELARVKNEIEAQTKAIAAIQDEARVAGVPAGWVR